MKERQNEKLSWSLCQECQGNGKKRRKLSKKVRQNYKALFEQFQINKGESEVPLRPLGQLYLCENCKGSGLIRTVNPPKANKESFPHVAIIGGGIGGVALAVACLHRGIPFTLYERDKNFDVRSQGYGLTLQQASKVIESFGICSLSDGVISTRHLVHTPEGKVIGEWGMRKWISSNMKTTIKRSNIHIARQSLRSALLEQIDGYNEVQWDHKLIDFKETPSEGIVLKFQVNGEVKTASTDLLVGADGIRSSVRKFLLDEETTSLHYLGCMVILGICPLNALKNITSPLLDSATVFQTANGHERIYIMPYTSESVMWQLSFPIAEEEAKMLSAKGTQALKKEACRRTPWHNPIPEILAATLDSQISGYPVYDRELLDPVFLNKGKDITLLGDAAHPMSPFKGQGANQALLDALELARGILRGCGDSNWRKIGIRQSVLLDYEENMLMRSASKVKDSAHAANFLHSEIVLFEGNKPRGSYMKS